MNRVGFWRRAIAATIDALCAAVVLVPAEVARQGLIASGELQVFGSRAFVLGERAFLLALFGFEVVAAASLGKLALRLEIANSDGSDASTATLLNRWTAKWSFLFVAMLYDATENTFVGWLANLLFFVVLIGCFAAAGESKMAWHDQWARTAVYRAKDRRKQRGFEVVQSPDPSTGVQS